MNLVGEFGGPIPIILGSYVNAIGLIRSFAAQNVPTICLDHKKGLAGYSKYTQFDACPNPIDDTEAFINYLLKLGGNLPFKGVLFATNDEWLIPISKWKNILNDYYIYPMSDWPIIEASIDKQKMYEIAKDANIPIPKTHFLDNVHEIQSIKGLAYPLIMKPSITVNFSETLKSSGRTIFIEDDSQLSTYYNKIIEAGLGDIPLVVQEYIPSSFGDLYTITSYANQKSKITAYSTGYKIGQYPSVAGTITCGFVKDKLNLYDLAADLIKALKFYGISNIEFKYDYRDKIFKLMEINPRPGKWNYSVYASGLNLPYIAYLDALGKENHHNFKGKDNIFWLHLRDVITSFFVDANRGMIYNKQSRPTLHRIIKALCKAKIVFAVESLRDPKPMIYEWSNLVYNVFRR